MPLGPEDVIRKTFATASLAKRGYDKSDVDAFLEEVVTDLRRRDSEREELLYHASRSAQRGAIEGDRSVREREQLDVIRAERQDLVSELRDLATRCAEAQRQLEEIEQRLEETERLRVEAQSSRDTTAREVAGLRGEVARATTLYNDLRGAYGALTAELHDLRTEAEILLKELTGEKPTESTGSPVDDLVAIRDVAQRLRLTLTVSSKEYHRPASE